MFTLYYSKYCILKCKLNINFAENILSNAIKMFAAMMYDVEHDSYTKWLSIKMCFYTRV